MNSLKIIICTIASVLLLTSAGVEAQYHWHRTHSEQDTAYYYSFSCISCFGDVCTAACEASTKPNFRLKILFLRSTDGGLTWNNQDPGLPRPKTSTQNIHQIQQIDSLNTIAIGDTGLIVHTLDGGITWEKQSLNISYRMTDIHFFNSLEGIASSGGYRQVHTTSDGGKTWTDAPFDRVGIVRCHSYGNGVFKVFQYATGTIYSTKDNWVTFDSTKPVFDTFPDSIKVNSVLGRCVFNGDTIITFGILYTNNGFVSVGLIERTTNGGISWEPPVYYHNGYLSDVLYVSPINHDTIFAQGTNYAHSFLLSTDRGATWKPDSNIIDTSFPDNDISALTTTESGRPIISFAQGNMPGTAGILAVGVPAKLKVESYERIVYNTHIYPNPATTEVTIVTVDHLRTVHLIDILGREVMSAMTSDQGKATFDLSQLPRGIYSIVLDHYGKMLPVGKVAVTGK